MSYSPPFTVIARPSNFANAWRRSFAPKVLQVVHVTGNSDVAAYPDGFDKGESPNQDWLYAARNPASEDGPSAHDYVGRRGSTIEMWNPRTHVAWSNGDIKRPNLSLPGVAYLDGLRRRGINANRGVYRELELSGYPGTYDPTYDQLEVCAYFAALDSIETGLEIKRGTTILTHADINSVDRANCAFRPAIREARLAWLVNRALHIRALLQEDDVVIPGLALVDFEPAAGFVQFKTDGLSHAYVQVADREYFFLPGGVGSRKPVIGTARLAEPLDRAAGDRQTVYVIGGPGVEVAVGLAVDIDPKEVVSAVDAERKRAAAIVSAALAKITGGQQP